MRALTRPAAVLTAAALAATLAACGSGEKPEAGPSAVNTDIAPPTATAAETFDGQGLSTAVLTKLSTGLSTDLARGDEKGFLSNFAPGHPRLVAQQRTWFRNVRAMPLSTRKMVVVRPTRSIDSSGKGVLEAYVGFLHAFQGADPRPLAEWYSFGFKKVGDALRIVSVGGAPAEEFSGEKFSRYYRQSWDDGPATAVSDDKVIVVGLASDRGTMQRMLPSLSQGVRDTLDVFRRAKADVAPSVYTRRWVFTLAAPGVEDFFDYYGGVVKRREANFAAFTEPVLSSGQNAASLDYDKGNMTSRIVMNREMTGYSGSQLGSVVRHELVHAVQQSWDDSATAMMPTWVTEGLAVYAGNPPASERSFRSGAGRRGLASATVMPTRSFYQGNDDAVAQHYGMGYLAVSYLVETKGLPAVLRAVRKVEMSGSSRFLDAVGVSDERTFVKNLKKWAGA